MKELIEMKVDVQLVTIGKKAAKYFKRRPQYKMAGKLPLHTRCARLYAVLCLLL